MLQTGPKKIQDWCPDLKLVPGPSCCFVQGFFQPPRMHLYSQRKRKESREKGKNWRCVHPSMQNLWDAFCAMSFADRQKQGVTLNQRWTVWHAFGTIKLESLWHKATFLLRSIYIQSCRYLVGQNSSAWFNDEKWHPENLPVGLTSLHWIIHWPRCQQFLLERFPTKEMVLENYVDSEICVLSSINGTL